MSGSNDRTKLGFAGFTVDLARLSVDRDDEPIYVRPKSFDVLRYLAENRAAWIARERMRANADGPCPRIAAPSIDWGLPRAADCGG